jgi:hypothetical protein
MGNLDFVYWGGGGSGGGGGGGAAFQIGGNTSGTTAIANTGTITLVGGNNVTISQVGNAFTFSVPNTASQTVQTQGIATFQQWWPNIAGGPSSARTYGQSTVHVDPVWVPSYVTATRAHIAINVSMTTSSNSSYAATLSVAIGIYTLNGSTLSLGSSGSTNYQFTNTSDNSTNSLQGNRILSIPCNANMSPGLYWIGFMSQTASANANSFQLNNILGFTSGNSGSFGAQSSGTYQPAVGMGHWTAQTAQMPSSMAISDLRYNAPMDMMQNYVSFFNSTV